MCVCVYVYGAEGGGYIHIIKGTGDLKIFHSHVNFNAILYH